MVHVEIKLQSALSNEGTPRLLGLLDLWVSLIRF